MVKLLIIYNNTTFSQPGLPECYSKAAPFPLSVFIARMLRLPIYWSNGFAFTNMYFDLYGCAEETSPMMKREKRSPRFAPGSGLVVIND